MQYNRPIRIWAAGAKDALCGKEGMGMEKTRCRLNICGVEVTVAGDVDREAAEQIAEAVRTRIQHVLSTAHAATVEKAAVITAMNLCEELARLNGELEQSRAQADALEAELRQLGGADGLKSQLRQAEGKLRLCEEQLQRAQAALKERETEDRAEKKEPAHAVKMRNPLRPDIGEQEGLVSFFAKE